ncbi:MAG: hypothetical protein H6806_13180 [Planctomycetes bacterium]|nr:hypothetical protein [Planctomycetota bacterium]
MAIEILIPTTRTLGGAARVLLQQLQTKGFQNIDPPESQNLEVEVMNVDGESAPRMVPEDISAEDLGEEIKANRELVCVRIPLRLGHFLLFPRFVVLCRPDDYDDFINDPRARQIIGREALELAHAFQSPELIVCGDAATDFLGTEATTWEELKDVLDEEEVPHRMIELPR